MTHASLLTLVLALAGPGACADWPTFCHDLARTGIAETAGPSSGEVVWTADLGDSVDGSPIVVGDRIYVGNSAGEFFALRRDTGEVLWRRATGGAIAGAAEVADGRVFVGCADCMLYALDARDGSVLWRHRTVRPILAGSVVTHGKVIFGSMDGTVRAVDPETGKMIWKVEAGGAVSAALAADEKSIYYGDEKGGVHALDIETGESIWSGKLSGRIIAAPTIADAMLLVPLMSLSSLSPPKIQYLTAWSLADGKKLWTAKPSQSSVMGSVATSQGIVWAFLVEGYTSAGRLVGVELASGKQVAETKMGSLVVDASLAVAGGTLYIAAQNGAVYFANAKTGALEKRVQLGGKVFSSPAIADGRLYVGCQDGKLYCIR